jgi:hypothetical protein
MLLKVGEAGSDSFGFPRGRLFDSVRGEGVDDKFIVDEPIGGPHSIGRRR